MAMNPAGLKAAMKERIYNGLKAEFSCCWPRPRVSTYRWRTLGEASQCYLWCCSWHHIRDYTECSGPSRNPNSWWTSISSYSSSR